MEQDQKGHSAKQRWYVLSANYKKEIAVRDELLAQGFQAYVPMKYVLLKVKGTRHWVSAATAVEAEVRLYDQLFPAEDPMDVPEGRDWHEGMNPESLRVVKAMLEPSLAAAVAGERFQFERMGYFAVDLDARPGAPVFNRTVSLKDSWAKIEAKG